MRVGVIMGGTSSERDVSLRSGRAVAAALRENGHEVVSIEVRSERDLAGCLLDSRLDAAFIAMHGRFGEDGRLQALLELAGIPYTGSDVLSSALAMDKLKAKEMFRLHNVPTPPYYTLSRAERSRLADFHGSFGFPVVVKPRREGSSFGVAKADDAAELARAVDAALELDDAVVVERFVRGAEVAVGILDGRVLGAIEISPPGDLYDTEAKYESSETQYFIPARLPASRLVGVLNLAQRAAEALDCQGATRVDLLVTEGGNEYVLEVNTSPGMTETSLLPKIAEAAGYDFASLCQTILEAAVGTEARPSVEVEAAPSSETLAAEPVLVAV